MKIKYLLILFAIVSVLLLNNCTKSDVIKPDIGNSENIRIGMLEEFGPAWNGELTLLYDVLDLAVKDINAAGGVHGKNIEIVLRDAFEDPLASIKDLRANNINFILGPGWSSRVLEISDYAKENRMLILSGSATSPEISTLVDNNMIWRTCVSDAFQSVVSADYIKNTLLKNKIAIIYRNDEFGSGIASSLKTEFEGIGGTVTSTVSYDAEAPDFSVVDFSDEVATVMSGAPDMIFFVSFDVDGTQMLTDLYANSAYQANKPDLFGGGINELYKVSLPADMLEGMRAIQIITDPEPNSNFAKFKSHVQSSLPFAEPDYFVACAYDNLYLLVYAMIKSGSVPNPSLVAAELQGVSGGVSGATIVGVNEFLSAKTLLEGGGDIDYNGASGRIEFDNNGDPGSGIFQVTRVVSGVEVEEQVINYP